MSSEYPGILKTVFRYSANFILGNLFYGLIGFIYALPFILLSYVISPEIAGYSILSFVVMTVLVFQYSMKQYREESNKSNEMENEKKLNDDQIRAMILMQNSVNFISTTLLLAISSLCAYLLFGLGFEFWAVAFAIGFPIINDEILSNKRISVDWIAVNSTVSMYRIIQTFNGVNNNTDYELIKEKLHQNGTKY